MYIDGDDIANVMGLLIADYARAWAESLLYNKEIMEIIKVSMIYPL